MTQELIADMLGVRREASPGLRRIQQNDFTKLSTVLRRPDKSIWYCGCLISGTMPYSALFETAQSASRLSTTVAASGRLIRMGTMGDFM